MRRLRNVLGLIGEVLGRDVGVTASRRDDGLQVRFDRELSAVDRLVVCRRFRELGVDVEFVSDCQALMQERAPVRMDRWAWRAALGRPFA